MTDQCIGNVSDSKV